MQPLIKVENLTKQFNKQFTAVNNLSFTVNKGGVYGFLGQNGAGKSTTIRMMMSLIQPTSGTIEIFGKNIEGHRAEVLRNIGAVIEKPDVYKYLTAYENLRLFAKLSGVKPTKELLMEQLETVGLSERAHSKVKTFSQGMKQRLGIAIALVHNPELIILDEPTNGLDPQGIADMRNLILHLNRERNKTVVVSSHLLSEIQQIATDIIIIDRGKKLIEGSAKELFDPSQTIVEIDTENNEAAFALLSKSEWQQYLQPIRNKHVILKMHKSDIAALHKYLANADAGIISLQPRHNLEDYFLQITSGKQHVEAFSN